MGLYLSADRLAEAIEKFEKGFTCGLPEGGSSDARAFRRHFEKLTPFARAAFVEQYPALWAKWIEVRRRPKKHGEQVEMF